MVYCCCDVLSENVIKRKQHYKVFIYRVEYDSASCSESLGCSTEIHNEKTA